MRRGAQADGLGELAQATKRRDKSEIMAIIEQTLATDPNPGISEDTIQAARRELRGE